MQPKKGIKTMIKNEKNRYGNLLDKFTEKNSEEEVRKRYGNLVNKFEEIQRKEEVEQAKQIIAINELIDSVSEERKEYEKNKYGRLLYKYIK